MTVLGLSLLIALLVLAAIVAVVMAVIVTQRKRPSSDSAGAIDPFTLDEPWRRLVQQGQQLQRRYGETLRTVPKGPLQERLASLGEEIQAAVREIWVTARSGHAAARARRAIDAPALSRRLDAATMSAPTPATAATVESITAQLEAASRLDEVLATTQQRLESALAGIELSTVTAVELSVGNGDPAGVDNLKEAVQHTSDGLESLRRALGELAPSAIRQPPPDLGSARGG